jgi:predicted glutamine amidotransferase
MLMIVETSPHFLRLMRLCQVTSHGQINETSSVGHTQTIMKHPIEYIIIEDDDPVATVQADDQNKPKQRKLTQTTRGTSLISMIISPLRLSHNCRASDNAMNGFATCATITL